MFPGGFTYSDVLGSAAGWQAVLTRNPLANEMLRAFRARPDTFVLGVCNGCQLLSRLGWIDGTLTHNQSGRFESRFVTVELTGDSFWTRGLNGARMGVWVAHGEGRFSGDDTPLEPLVSRTIVRYVNAETGVPTEAYPMNPNGSAGGVAGRISADGRVFGLMPHPERCFKSWQLPWCPSDWRERFSTCTDTPWLKLFRNAHEWCQG